MDFLRKVLLIAIVWTFAGNAEGMATVLDFNGITAHILDVVPPCFHPYNYNAPGIGQLPVKNLRNGVDYVYFNIIPGLRVVVATGGNNRIPISDEKNIYFPRDGHQPTTSEAVEYSCANIDNRPDSPITEWYIQMFGVIPINHVAIEAAVAAGNQAPVPVYVQAGWDGTPVAKKIVNFEWLNKLLQFLTPIGRIDNTLKLNRNPLHSLSMDQINQSQKCHLKSINLYVKSQERH